MAAHEVVARMERPTDEAEMAFLEEAKRGKMFGVLVVEMPSSDTENHCSVGYVAAYSGQLCGRSNWPDFVPAVFDYLQPDGYFKQREAQISCLNHTIEALAADEQAEKWRRNIAALHLTAEKELTAFRQRMQQAKVRRDELRQSATTDAATEAALIRESQFMKAELKRLKQRFGQTEVQLSQQLMQHEQQLERLKQQRKQLSDELQRWLFGQFVLLNTEGERCNLLQIFAHEANRIPPAGSGECCEPKLLQYAFAHGLRPLCMAMFWYGASPANEIRRHLHYYPACNGKCRPILQWMLKKPLPHLLPPTETAENNLPIVYEDESMVVVNKPAGMLSVPGKEGHASVYSLLCRRTTDGSGVFVVHRLDMATSGLLLVAKTMDAYHVLQRQFKEHSIRKEYIAVLEGVPDAGKWGSEGTISLPLRSDVMDRPRQLVDFEHGKEAVTDYKVMEIKGAETHIALYPRTGRTHQLRMHCAHPLGLGCPIKGDTLYGHGARRLFLHARSIEFTHPVSGKRMVLIAQI